MKLLIKSSIFIVSASLIGCAQKMKTADMSLNGRSIASVPVDNKVEFPALGLTLVLKDKSSGTPIAAIFDKNGEFYPELQSRINKKMKSSALVGFTVVASEIRAERAVYKDSKENYATLIIDAKTLNGLTKKSQALKFALPIERMMIAEKGGKANGLGYWNTTDVRALDPAQLLPF